MTRLGGRRPSALPDECSRSVPVSRPYPQVVLPTSKSELFSQCKESQCIYIFFIFAEQNLEFIYRQFNMKM